jgi:hypothetical protein
MSDTHDMAAISSGTMTRNPQMRIFRIPFFLCETPICLRHGTADAIWKQVFQEQSNSGDCRLALRNDFTTAVIIKAKEVNPIVC